MPQSITDQKYGSRKPLSEVYQQRVEGLVCKPPAYFGKLQKAYLNSWGKRKKRILQQFLKSCFRDLWKALQRIWNWRYVTLNVLKKYTLKMCFDAHVSSVTYNAPAGSIPIQLKPSYQSPPLTRALVKTTHNLLLNGGVHGSHLTQQHMQGSKSGAKFIMCLGRIIFNSVKGPTHNIF